MEQFILTAETITLDDGNFNIMVHPNEAIHNYLHSYKFVENGTLNQTVIDDFIIEQTPLLFDKLQEYYPDISVNYYL
jgi:hypothetical protein